MNIHGYKKKHKIIKGLLKQERSKQNPCLDKIRRLERSRDDCKKRILALREKRKQARRKQ